MTQADEISGIIKLIEQHKITKRKLSSTDYYGVKQQEDAILELAKVLKHLTLSAKMKNIIDK